MARIDVSLGGEDKAFITLGLITQRLGEFYPRHGAAIACRRNAPAARPQL
ncbi:MAG: hypothetical protein ACRCVA_00065 [Phreatobacter sp.]